MDNVVLRGACLSEADISGAQLDAFQMHEEAQTADLLRSLKEQLLRSDRSSAAKLSDPLGDDFV
jgi:uncharacterized protein YjbI with pentapeptide repeats